jgi:hypothetical protein
MTQTGLFDRTGVDRVFAAGCAPAVLRRELHRAVEREAAVRDVIQTIARTTFDLDAVLQTVIDRAVKLCRADNGNVARRDGDVFRVVAFTSFGPDFERLVRDRHTSNQGADPSDRLPDRAGD